LCARHQHIYETLRFQFELLSCIKDGSSMSSIEKIAVIFAMFGKDFTDPIHCFGHRNYRYCIGG
jgi:hypothetical protein